MGTTRARLSTTPSDDRHPPRVVCRAMERFGTRRVVATTPRAGAGRVPETRQRDSSHPLGTHEWKYVGASASSRVVQK